MPDSLTLVRAGFKLRSMPQKDFAEVAVVLRDTDSVAVLKRPVKAGDLLNGVTPLRVAQDIPAGHKIALAEVPDGGPVRKYGQVIGFANQDVPTRYWAGLLLFRTGKTMARPSSVDLKSIEWLVACGITTVASAWPAERGL